MDQIEAMRLAELALEQAQDCIRGETPEDMSHEEAREDTISKIREALRAIESAAPAQAQPSPATAGLIQALRSAWRSPFREKYRGLFIQAAVEIERLSAAAQSTASIRDAAQFVVDKFKADEAQGYHTNDRQFAIAVLDKALLPVTSTNGRDPHDHYSPDFDDPPLSHTQRQQEE